MSVADMERRFFELKGKLDVGAIGEDEFKSEVERLRFQDTQNHWWMIGAQSGKWYMYDGVRWIPGQPPQEAPAPAPPPAPPPVSPVVTSPVPQPAPAPQTITTVEAKSAPIPVAPIPRAPTTPPPTVSRRERRRTPLRSPVPVPALIGCAALVGIVLVTAILLAIENVVPGKPLSTFVGSLSGSIPGSQPKTTRTPTLPPGAASNAIQIVAMGDDLVSRSQFESAVTQYQAATQLAPSSSTALVRWSRALAYRGQLQDALAKARQAAQRTPNDAEAQAQLARVQAWLGQTSEAVAAGERAVKLDPKSAYAHAYLAEIYLIAKRNPDAQSEAQTAVGLAPQNADTHRAQAWVFTLMGQREIALGEWRQTIVLEPDMSFRHFEYGEALRLFFKDPTNAAAEYRRAIELYGAYIPAYNRLGLALLDANLAQQAVSPLQHAVTFDPTSADNQAYLGIAFGLTNKCAQAIPYFQQALAIDANNKVAAKGLSDCTSGKLGSAPAPVVPPSPLPPPTVPPSAGGASQPLVPAPTSSSTQP